jgi:hypothetical protein
MDLICRDCRGRRFLFDHDAVEYINKAGKRTSFEVVPSDCTELHCVNCFGITIQDRESGVFVNEPEGEELIKKLLDLRGKVIDATILPKKSQLVF